jgi:hypothetical protein
MMIYGIFLQHTDTKFPCERALCSREKDFPRDDVDGLGFGVGWVRNLLCLRVGAREGDDKRRASRSDVDGHAGVDSDAALRRCRGVQPLLATSDLKSDLFNSAAILIGVGIAAVERHTRTTTCYEAIIKKPFIIYRSPDAAQAVCAAVAILNHAILVLARLGRAGGRGVVVLATRREALANGTRHGEVAAGLWLQVPVVHLHLHYPHELNLSRQLLYLFLPRVKAAAAATRRKGEKERRG